MERVLQLNSTDEHITYNSGWKRVSNTTEGQNGTHFLATDRGAEFFFMFRGTSARFYGRLGGGGGDFLFRLDTNSTNVSLNGTNFGGGPALIWNVDNLEDGDHQLLVVVKSLKQNGTVAVDYFEVENSSGQGFDFLWAGPNATNVPKEAITVDNSSEQIVLSNPSAWGSADNALYYGRSTSYTTQAGASLNFSFDGVAIWYYGDRDSPHGFYTVTIDGSEPERLNGYNEGGQLTQQMKWSKTNLSPGTHTFTLRQVDVGGKYLSLDFFRVLPADNASALPSSTPTSTDAVAPASTSNVVPLAVGLTFGLLAVAITVLGAFYLQRRRRRKSALLDTHTSSPYHSPPKQADQRSRGPPESKRHPPPTQAPTFGPALSPGVPGATVVPAMSIGMTESEMPPSYESHWGVGMAL